MKKNLILVFLLVLIVGSIPTNAVLAKEPIPFCEEYFGIDDCGSPDSPVEVEILLGEHIMVLDLKIHEETNHSLAFVRWSNMDFWVDMGIKSFVFMYIRDYFDDFTNSARLGFDYNFNLRGLNYYLPWEWWAPEMHGIIKLDSGKYFIDVPSRINPSFTETFILTFWEEHYGDVDYYDFENGSPYNPMLLDYADRYDLPENLGWDLASIFRSHREDPVQRAKLMEEWGPWFYTAESLIYRHFATGGGG